MIVNYSKRSDQIFYEGKAYARISRERLRRRLESGPVEVIMVREYFMESGGYAAQKVRLTSKSYELQLNLVRIFVLEELC